MIKYIRITRIWSWLGNDLRYVTKFCVLVHAKIRRCRLDAEWKSRHLADCKSGDRNQLLYLKQTIWFVPFWQCNDNIETNGRSKADGDFKQQTTRNPIQRKKIVLLADRHINIENISIGMIVNYAVSII